MTHSAANRDPVGAERLAQQGDPDAIGALYDQHYPAVLRYFRSRVSGQEAAEDLTADVFKQMVAALPQYRALGLPFRAWLFRIAHNRLVDHYRKESSQVSVRLEAVEHQTLAGEDPALVAEQRLTLEHAIRALAELEPGQRDVLSLRFLSGLSLRDTALALGKTEDAVKALQRRGLAALRLAVTE
jgi:RNA polymerase sigma-70 factor (ECF subfamily)